jgi:hypothetical protein
MRAAGIIAASNMIHVRLSLNIKRRLCQKTKAIANAVGRCRNASKPASLIL